MKKTQLSFETAQFNENTLASELLKIAKERKLVQRQLYKYKSNPKFSSIYNFNELESILNETITKVVLSFTVFKLRKMKKRVPKNMPNVKEQTDLSTLGKLTGYFISAYDNNISKDYKKYIAERRIQHEVSIEGGLEVSQQDDGQSSMIFNQVSHDPFELLINQSENIQLMEKIYLFLEKYDEKMNDNYVKENGKFPENEKISNLKLFFTLLLDNDYKGKYIHLKDYLPNWSCYIFNKNKEVLIDLIKQNFAKDLRNFYGHVTDEQNFYGETLTPKKSTYFFDVTCEINKTIEEKPITKNKSEYFLIVQIIKNENNRMKVLTAEKFDKKNDEFISKKNQDKYYKFKTKGIIAINKEKAIEKLNKEASECIEFYNEIIEDRKRFAYNNLYKKDVA